MGAPQFCGGSSRESVAGHMNNVAAIVWLAKYLRTRERRWPPRLASGCGDHLRGRPRKRRRRPPGCLYRRSPRVVSSPSARTRIRAPRPPLGSLAEAAGTRVGCADRADRQPDPLPKYRHRSTLGPCSTTATSQSECPSNSHAYACCSGHDRVGLPTVRVRVRGVDALHGGAGGEAEDGCGSASRRDGHRGRDACRLPPRHDPALAALTYHESVTSPGAKSATLAPGRLACVMQRRSRSAP